MRCEGKLGRWEGRGPTDEVERREDQRWSPMGWRGALAASIVLMFNVYDLTIDTNTKEEAGEPCTFKIDHKTTPFTISDGVKT